MVKSTPPPTSYKTHKELFVSGLAGGSITEINYVTAVAPAAYILTSALHSRLEFFADYGHIQFLVDFGLNVGAILLATTTYADRPLLLCALLVGPALLLLAQGQTVKKEGRQMKKTARKPPKKQVEKAVEVKKEIASVGLPKKAFVTTYRGAMMAITCLAILAVDFKVFPRRFAKVETWGTSLMDLGVGSFVFSSGLVAARPVVSGKASPVSGLGKRLQSALRSTLALLVLGGVRLILVKGVDYAEHVTEYGIHWNFFFTLALLPLFSTLVLPLTTRLSSPAISPSVFYTGLALTIATLDQLALSKFGLLKFVLTAPRHSLGLISENKEGIFSFPGYLAIFFAGTAAGCSCLPSLPNHNTALGLAKWATFWITAFYLTTTISGPFRLEVSRRVANAPYVFWVAAFNTAQLAGFTLVEKIFPQGGPSESGDPENSQSRVLTAFNDNGLAIFLLANLGTGLVNLSFDTLGAGTGKALGILGVYAVVVSAVAVGLQMGGVRVKL
ncbi:GPI-anchored wall transfer protein 1 [Ascobolus immersus RN42]|uniref:GPI-anchored wall transfer protein n=1 Tax=Ascobolus immersus RN42 TaxID=1160509 RepID=A0A3N4HXJ5_ASCIM|nr:GPI-anchored wall transfer protein 1 [Ascobolus immersus RN42]